MNVLIHGYNVHDPMTTVGRLQKRLPNTYLFAYGWFGLTSVLLYNKREAKRLKVFLDENPRSVVYAHSNGCAIAVLAAELGAKIQTLVCINPALKVDYKFPDTIKNVCVVHTSHDKPTKVARFLDKVPFIQLLVPNAWGAMGSDGAEDKRVKNFDFTQYLDGHSAFFEYRNMDKCLPIIREWISKL